jgi:hypothetical protein
MVPPGMEEARISQPSDVKELIKLARHIQFDEPIEEFLAIFAGFSLESLTVAFRE